MDNRGPVMPLNEKQLGMLLVGAAVVGVLAYIAHNESNAETAPRYDSPLAAVGVSASVIDRLDTGDHYFHPNYCVPGQTQIYTPHRYPVVSGGNISTLIHHGMDRLAVDAPQDNEWIKRPPAEVMW